MDKQIIIDGVDVSKCLYSKTNNKMIMCKACNSGVGSPYCEYHKDCYYKQLKRKEQECEQLRETMHKDICSHYVLGECSQKHHNNCVGRNQCIKDLEQECERLNKQLISFMSGDYCANGCSLKQQLDQLKKENEELEKDNKALCERCVKLEEEVERQRTIAREYECRWLNSYGL